MAELAKYRGRHLIGVAIAPSLALNAGGDKSPYQLKKDVGTDPFARKGLIFNVETRVLHPRAQIRP